MSKAEADAAATKGRFADAERIYLAVLARAEAGEQHNDNDVRARVAVLSNLALAQARQGAARLDDAVDTASKAVSCDPAWSRSYHRLAEVLLIARRYDDALATAAAGLVRDATDQKLLAVVRRVSSAMANRDVRTCTTSAARWGTWDTKQVGVIPRGRFDVKPPALLPGYTSSAGSDLSVAAIACGDAHALILTLTGQVFQTGRIYSSGKTVDWESPDELQLVPGLHDVHVTAVACGRAHCLALDATGRVWAWGRGLGGALGLGRSACSSFVDTASRVRGALTSSRAVAIAAGDMASFAITRASRTLLAWGTGNQGRLGMGIVHGDRQVDEPSIVPSMSDIRVRMVACGWTATAVLTVDGTVLSFGANKRGVLGYLPTLYAPAVWSEWNLMRKERADAFIGVHLSRYAYVAPRCGWLSPSDPAWCKPLQALQGEANKTLCTQRRQVMRQQPVQSQDPPPLSSRAIRLTPRFSTGNNSVAQRKTNLLDAMFVPPSSLRTDMHTLLQTAADTWADVTLTQGDDQVIHLHRFVLACRVPAWSRVLLKYPERQSWSCDQWLGDVQVIGLSRALSDAQAVQLEMSPSSNPASNPTALAEAWSDVLAWVYTGMLRDVPSKLSLRLAQVLGVTSLALADTGEARDRLPPCQNLNVLQADVRRALDDPVAFADVSIRAGEHDDGQAVPLRAHRALLAARCEPLRALLTAPMREREQSCLVLPERQETLSGFISWLYTDHDCLVTHDRDTDGTSAQLVMELLVLAGKYTLQRLKAICERELAENVDETSAEHVALFANEYHARQLRDYCLRIMSMTAQRAPEAWPYALREALAWHHVDNPVCLSPYAQYTPAPVPGLTAALGNDVIDIALGEKLGAAVTSAGAVYVWGVGSNAELRRHWKQENVVLLPEDKHNQLSRALAPKRVSGLPPIAHVVCGSSHVTAWTRDGDVYCWGAGWLGQCGCPPPCYHGVQFTEPLRLTGTVFATPIAGIAASPFANVAWSLPAPFASPASPTSARHVPAPLPATASAHADVELVFSSALRIHAHRGFLAYAVPEWRAALTDTAPYVEIPVASTNVTGDDMHAFFRCIYGCAFSSPADAAGAARFADAAGVALAAAPTDLTKFLASDPGISVPDVFLACDTAPGQVAAAHAWLLAEAAPLLHRVWHVHPAGNTPATPLILPLLDDPAVLGVFLAAVYASLPSLAPATRNSARQLLLELSLAQAIELLRSCRLWGIASLARDVQLHLGGMLSPENVPQVWAAAKQLECPLLQHLCRVHASLSVDALSAAADAVARRDGRRDRHSPRRVSSSALSDTDRALEDLVADLSL